MIATTIKWTISDYPWQAGLNIDSSDGSPGTAVRICHNEYLVAIESVIS